MATPVPVVSMMYFFVSTPPKTFTAVSPAFSAISMKFAIFGLSPVFCATFSDGKGLPSSRLKPAPHSNTFPKNAHLVPGLNHFKRSPRASGIVGWYQAPFLPRRWAEAAIGEQKNRQSDRSRAQQELPWMIPHISLRSSRHQPGDTPG